MSNTVITNYTDLNGPSSKSDNSVVVIVNKDGSLSVDQKLLGTLMGTDGSQGAGISVVRVGHEGRPDDATDSESEDDKLPHVTLSVDSYYDEPSSILKYDSGAEMFQSLRIETRENSLLGFQNDHCYTPLVSPGQSAPQKSDSYSTYDESVIEITHTPPPKPIPSSKKITILDQKIIPKGRKIVLNPTDASTLLKNTDSTNKPVSSKVKQSIEQDRKSDDNSESSSISSSGDSIPDRDSDSDYRDKSGGKKAKSKPRILKTVSSKSKNDSKMVSKLKSNKTLIRKELKDRSSHKNVLEKKYIESDLPMHSDHSLLATSESNKSASKQTPKSVKKEKKTPARVTALLTDMTSLFSTPDVIRRVSTDTKTPLTKPEKESNIRKSLQGEKLISVESDKPKTIMPQKTYSKQKIATDKVAKGFELIPQLDDASLAQILQETSGISHPVKGQPNAGNTMNSPSLAGPLSPTLDILGGLQPEEEGLTEDLLMHVAQLVESSENLQEVIDKQVLGKVDTATTKSVQPPFHQEQSTSDLYTPPKSAKQVPVRSNPIEIVRRDGRVITLPPIEAPATRSSKRKTQLDTSIPSEPVTAPSPVLVPAVVSTPEPELIPKPMRKLVVKRQEPHLTTTVAEKASPESQESWASEDDPNRLWCICKQPHNNRFMICCDGCEDWFHGKCVNITKALGQQMEEKGMEWRCPNCIKKKEGGKTLPKIGSPKKKEEDTIMAFQKPVDTSAKTTCIVCKAPARSSSIYCSDACILKHAQDSLSQNSPTKTDFDSSKPQEKQKSESRVIVYERKSGRLLAGPNAPTAENLKTWLQKNPTFEVVRPGTLSTIKPKLAKKKLSLETNKIQTTLNFQRIPKKVGENTTPGRIQLIDPKAKTVKTLPSPRDELKAQPRTPVTPKPQIIPRTPNTPRSQPSPFDSPRPSTSSAKTVAEPKKPSRPSTSRSLSTNEKLPSVSPSTSRRKDMLESKHRAGSTEPIRENVRKALQEQITSRMAETKGAKFTEEQIHDFAIETELELHELFKDVGIKYKAKYRSLMFNIKDRKNLTLWDKICDGSITPKQLVRLSPEELASQELAQWRDKEAKHQLELIKKSELDLLAASKTYVLKTHKGEEVMETKESVSTELDPNVPVEDLVTALNDSTAGADETSNIISEDTVHTTSNTDSSADKKRSKKLGAADSTPSHSKKKSKESKRESVSRRSSRRKSDGKDKEERVSRRSERRSSRTKSTTKESKVESKEKGDGDRSRRRSRSRSRSRGRDRRSSKSRESSRSKSRRESSRERRRSSRSKHSTSTEDKLSKIRSRSQENVYTKSKNDSTDSDSVERPKSAMLKEIHPEYDPHEPMITSAFSDEDLRKSRDNVYEDDLQHDMEDYSVAAYDPTQSSFSIDTGIASGKQVSEAESDQEPSSTVEHSAAVVWNGCINMVDVARFYVAAHEVSGSCTDLEEDLSAELDIVGRIKPDTVWDYISKMKRASNKDIVILKMQAANDEEKMQYIALYSYLSSRDRLGVVKVSNTATVKDLYIVPLSASAPLPSVLLPLDGPGLGDARNHLLIAIIIRQRKKRPATHIPKDIIPAKVARETRNRSYTPPVKSTYTPPTSPRRKGLPLPSYTSPALSSSVKDKIAASLAACDDEEAYSPGSSSSGGSVPNPPPTNLRNKMEELNRQIEEQKQQIMKMAQADSSNEAYSPSRPMTPPSVNPLSEISLPSNLQEILANIKQRSETTSGDVDMRNNAT